MQSLHFPCVQQSPLSSLEGAAKSPGSGAASTKPSKVGGVEDKLVGGPRVHARGKDKSIVLWSIHDHISSLTVDQGAAKSPGSGAASTKPSKVGGVEDKLVGGPCVHAREEFCSVGDDSCLILWDARTGSAPVIKVEKCHSADLHCVDWTS